MKSVQPLCRSLVLASLGLCGLAQAQLQPGFQGPASPPPLLSSQLRATGNGLSGAPLSWRLSYPTAYSNRALDYGLRSETRLVRPAGNTTGLVPRAEPTAYLSYSIIPQRLGLQSSLRLGSGRDARGMALDVQLSSAFAVTEETRLGLSASTSWLNSSATREWVGDFAGGNAGYAMEAPGAGLRDVRAGISLAGPLADGWSYTTGASLGRFYGDPRSAALLNNGGNGTVGLVFFKARYQF